MKSDVATISGLLDHVQDLINDRKDFEDGDPVCASIKIHNFD